MLVTKKTRESRHWWDVEKREPLRAVGRNVN